jgi:hypothetical protein
MSDALANTGDVESNRNEIPEYQDRNDRGVLDLQKKFHRDLEASFDSLIVIEVVAVYYLE